MNPKTVTRFAAVLAATFTLALAPVPASAQELTPEHIALAREFVDLTDKANTYELSVIETGRDVLRYLTQQNPEIPEVVANAVDSAIKAYADRKDELFDQFARVYAVYFTPEELEEINAFYSSDVGQKLSSTSYSVNQDLDSVMTIYRNNLRTEFLSMVRANLREAGVEI